VACQKNTTVVTTLTGHMVIGQLADTPNLTIHRRVNSQMTPLTVTVNMLKISDTLKAFVGIGFPVGLLFAFFRIHLLAVFKKYL